MCHEQGPYTAQNTILHGYAAESLRSLGKAIFSSVVEYVIGC